MLLPPTYLGANIEIVNTGQPKRFIEFQKSIYLQAHYAKRRLIPEKIHTPSFWYLLQMFNVCHFSPLAHIPTVIHFLRHVQQHASVNTRHGRSEVFLQCFHCCRYWGYIIFELLITAQEELHKIWRFAQYRNIRNVAIQYSGPLDMTSSIHATHFSGFCTWCVYVSCNVSAVFVGRIPFKTQFFKTC